MDFSTVLPINSHLSEIVDKYGDDNWTGKEVENNELIYGVIIPGMTELHIYKLNSK